MNRRRAIKRSRAKWHAVPVNVAENTLLKLGDRYTIAGLRLLPSGRFLTDCKPGEETILIVSARPSIYKQFPRTPPP